MKPHIKILSLLPVLITSLVLMLLVPSVVQAQFNYTVTNGTVTITGYTGPGGAVTIPTNINNLLVTSIGSRVFYNNTNLTNITISGMVTSIGDYAFSGCTNLTSATIGNNVTTIGDLAFEGCQSLTSVMVPNSVINIADEAFELCKSLTSVTIGTNVTTIGDWAFDGCTSLTNITIPNSVTNIAPGAFYQCYSLTAITVDTRNSVYSDLDGVLFNQSLTTLLEYPDGINGNYTIPNSVTTIGDYAFAGSSLVSMTIPGSVTSIGEAAYFSCTSLTNIRIGTNVTTIGNQAFWDCFSMTSVTIPSSVTTIGAYAFYNCTSLTNVTIPDSVTYIGNDAFYACSKLTSVTIGRGVAYVGPLAFFDCPSLQGVYFLGNAPSEDSEVFSAPQSWGYNTPATVYYLPGTTGWGTVFFRDTPIVPWQAQVQTSDADFGVRSNQFGFNINWASGMTIVVEASTTLANPIWAPVTTNALSGGTFYFSDPQWTNYPSRFYRVRSQ